MLGQFVANLLVPSDPDTLALTLPAATWQLVQNTDFSAKRVAMSEGQCAETYIITTPISQSDGAAAFDAAFDELTPIFLAASYATGLAVTSRRSTPMSTMSMQYSDHWPRARAMDQASFIVTSDAEFIELVDRFVRAWPASGVKEKARLLVHHWLDSLVCWSMEDLYLSATTLMQVIVATEADRQCKNRLEFYSGVKDAAARFGLTVLSDDFKNMRNELIHDGQLIGRRFSGPDKIICADVITSVLNWLDEYIHAALNLGSVRKVRFKKSDFYALNSYSIG